MRKRSNGNYQVFDWGRFSRREAGQTMVFFLGFLCVVISNQWRRRPVIDLSIPVVEAHFSWPIYEHWEGC